MSEDSKQLCKKIMEHVVLLPVDLQMQVLDFVLFLKYKQEKANELLNDSNKN